jgi:hypothetical protein
MRSSIFPASLSATSLTESPTISLDLARPVCSENCFVLEMVSGFLATGFVAAAVAGLAGGVLAGVVVGVPVDDPVNPGWALFFGTGTVPGAVPD